MEALEELRKWEQHPRFYRISSEIEDSANLARHNFLKKYGKDVWEDCCKLVTPGSKTSYPVYAATTTLR